jgi:hypothetical protein
MFQVVQALPTLAKMRFGEKKENGNTKTGPSLLQAPLTQHQTNTRQTLNKPQEPAKQRRHTKSRPKAGPRQATVTMLGVFWAIRVVS